MAQQNINIGTQDAKDGDTLFDAFTKTQENFAELFEKRTDAIIIVKQASDFGVIDATKIYFVDGIVDMGVESIEVPANGINLAGYGSTISKLGSSQPAYSLFKSPIGGSGTVFAKDITFDVSGTGSQVYDLTDATGFNSVEVVNLNYENCSSLGELNGYRQGLELNSGRFGGSPELCLSGTWLGGFFINTSITRNTNVGVYSIFKAGASFVMNSRFKNNMNIDLSDDNTFINFVPANFPNSSTIQFENMLISRNGVFNSDDGNISPNITADNLACAWRGNVGIDNTFEGGTAMVAAEATTNITAVGTFVDAAGIFTISNLQHFDSPGEGQLRNLGVSPEEFRVTCAGAVQAGANDRITVKVVRFKASNSTFIDLGQQTVQITNSIGGDDLSNFVFTVTAKLLTNDYVKIQLANQTATTNIILREDSSLYVEAR